MFRSILPRKSALTFVNCQSSTGFQRFRLHQDQKSGHFNFTIRTYATESEAPGKFGINHPKTTGQNVPTTCIIIRDLEEDMELVDIDEILANDEYIELIHPDDVDKDNIPADKVEKAEVNNKGSPNSTQENQVVKGHDHDQVKKFLGHPTNPKDFKVAGFKLPKPSKENKFYNETNIEIAKNLAIEILYGAFGIISAFVRTCIPRRFRYKSVNGQIVLITGGASGIGRLMAKGFALEHGATVVSWDINEDGNEQNAREIMRAGGKCFPFVVDVTDRVSVYETAKQVMDEVGKVDILINNAGIVGGARLLESPDENIIRIFNVNSLSNFWLTKAFLPDMIRTQRGHIVTIGSLAGLVGMNQLVDYCSSKFAAVGFHEALMNELNCNEESKCINTTLVCPYYIHTGMFDGIESKIIPVLRPQPVADNIISGILANEESITIPSYIYLLVLFKNMVPGEVGRRLASGLGITSTMVHFKGRQRF